MNPRLIPVIAGIVGGVVLLNICLGFAWWMMKRRTRLRQRLSPKTKEIPSSSTLLPSLPASATYTATEQSSQGYMHIMMSLQRDGIPGKHVPDVLPTTASSIPTAPEPSHSHPTPLTQGTLPSHTGSSAFSSSSLRRGPSVLSADSASIYSAASAPLDLHDRLFQPGWGLDTIPGSPSNPSYPSDAHSPTLSPISEPRDKWAHSKPKITMIREELAPETYATSKVRWKVPLAEDEENNDAPCIIDTPAFTHKRVRSSSTSALPPVPPLPAHLIVKPPGALTSIPHSSLRFSRFRSHSESEFRSSPILSSSYPTPALIPIAKKPSPPGIPPRSPLRSIT